METPTQRDDALIAKSYKENFDKVLRYISSRVNNVYDAENLTQDVWLRLLTCGRSFSEASITEYIFTVARNLVNDYLRHLYVVRDSHEEILLETSEACVGTPETEVSASQLAEFEAARVERLPSQRRIIYIMSRFDDKSVSDIANDLSLSIRTVENHLRLGRKEVRSYIAAIA